MGQDVQKLSDAELLAKVRSGQGDFFVFLYDRHAPAAYRHILFRCGRKEIAEDVVSQAFLKIWEELSAGKHIRSFRAFLFQTVRNLFVDITRKKEFHQLSVESLVDERHEPSSPLNTAEEVFARDEAENLRKVLGKLPEHYREILTLRYLDELTIAEIAAVTGKKSGAIYVSLHRGLRLLRQALVEAEPL